MYKACYNVKMVCASYTKPDLRKQTSNTERTSDMTFQISLIIAAIAALPWLFSRKFAGAGIMAVIAFITALFLVWVTMPTTAGPLFGGVGVISIIFFFISGMISSKCSDNKAPAFIGIFALIAVAVIAICSSPFFRAKSYAALAPHVEPREWLKDFQPKDPRHFRISSSENALFLAGRAIGQATTLDSNGQPNAIGSQFKVFDEVSSVQIINGEIWTVVPLDWAKWGPQYSSTTGVPGYIKVSGENPTIPAEYVSLGNGHEFRYTPEAVFSKNLERLVWSNNLDKWIADIHLEIDENNKPHYIVSLSKPTIGWWGDKIVGAVIVDPTDGSGADKFIPLGKIPEWVDRVESQKIVHRNLDYHGKYAQGFLNRSFFGNSVLAATETHFGYGSDGEPVYATGITAHNNTGSETSKSGSLVAMYYTNTRTGETVEYMLKGGATEDRAIEQCNLIGDIRNKGYHGTTPQLYNVYGHISYVVPIQNASMAFAGVAIVSVMNPQIIAWGTNAHEAELAYKQVIVSSSSQMAIDGTRKLSTITGTVERMGSMLVSGSTTYFIQIKGMKHLLTVPITTSAKVPVTQIGDTVWVEYYDSGETVMPVNKFDNKSLELESSEIQKNVHNRAVNTVDQARAVENQRSDVHNILEKLSPADRALLEKNIK